MSDTIPQDDIPRKQCATCPNSYPATPEFFTKRGNRLRAECKECKKARNKAYADAHKEEITTKKKQYNELHREERLKYQKHRQQVHKEEISEQQRRRYQRNREQIRGYQKTYSVAHRKEHYEREKQYRKTERGRMIRRAGSQRHRARKIGIGGTLTAQQIQEKLKAQRYRCYYATCGYARFKTRKGGTYIYHLEHTIPVSRTDATPRHDVNYVVLACPSCNSKKNNKLPHEFFEGGRLF